MSNTYKSTIRFKTITDADPPFIIEGNATFFSITSNGGGFVLKNELDETMAFTEDDVFSIDSNPKAISYLEITPDVGSTCRIIYHSV